jgi:hypothetical protein
MQLGPMYENDRNDRIGDPGILPGCFSMRSLVRLEGC